MHQELALMYDKTCSKNCMHFDGVAQCCVHPVVSSSPRVFSRKTLSSPYGLCCTAALALFSHPNRAVVGVIHLVQNNDHLARSRYNPS